MTQTQILGNLGYGKSVKLKEDKPNYYNTLTGTIIGKVKDCDLYLILFDRSILANNGYYKSLINLSLGSPNRNLELAWGKYNGYWNEFIVPLANLELV